MTTTTFTEFRRHAKSYFDAVEHGEIVRILRHGKVIAEITPVHTERVPSWKREALKLYLPGASLSRVVLDERKDESI